jgi:CRP-like cAMP-binding protein
MLANDYGIMTPDGIRINVRLTQQDIANALSTTRVTVTRVIGQLKKEGWLKSSPQRYFVIKRATQLNQFRASSVRANHQ